jgi:hypothetical protein
MPYHALGQQWLEILRQLICLEVLRGPCFFLETGRKSRAPQAERDLLQKITSICPCLRKLDHWEGDRRMELLVKRDGSVIHVKKREATLADD